MALDIRNEDGIVILAPRGMLLGGKETEELEATIGEVQKSGNTMLLLDMSSTTFMTSIAIAVVIRAHISYAKRGGTVKICALDRHIREIFVITKLTMVFGDNLHDTVREGLESFRSKMAAIPG